MRAFPRLVLGGICALLWAAGPAQAQVLKAYVARMNDNRLSTAFINVPGGTLRVVPEAATDVWVVLFSAYLSSSSTANVTTEVQYLVNGVVSGGGGIQNQTSHFGAAWQHFYVISGTTLPQLIQVQIRDAVGDLVTARIEDLHIVAFKLPAGADYHYSQTPGVRAVAAAAWNPFETLTFTPASAGDYLVLGLANFNEGPGADGVGVRVNGALGDFWPISDGGAREGYAFNERNAVWSFFAARRQNLTASPQTYRIEANGATGGSTIRYTRLLAFRTDVFDDYQQAEDLAATSTTSATPVVKSTLTTNLPPGFRDYVVLQNLYLRGGLASTDERRAGFERNNVVEASFAHTLDHVDQRVSYGLFDAFTTDQSVLLENTFSSSNAAFTVTAKESTILVLRLSTADPTAVRGLATNGDKFGGLAWGDFNQDECLDLLVNTSDVKFASRLYLHGKSGASCTGSFTDVSQCLANGITATEAERSAIWGDFDNDGYLDFARNDPSFIEIYRNNGPGTTTGTGCGAGVDWSRFGSAGAPTRTFVTADLPGSYTDLNSERTGFIDFDSDGDLDLLSDNHDEGILIFVNDGAGNFSFVDPATLGLPVSGTVSIDGGSIADMDADGDVDFALRVETGYDIYENLGGTFSPVTTFDQPAINSDRGSTAWCDFDDDGDFDLFWTNLGTDQVWEQTGLGSGAFTARGVPTGIVGDIEGVDCDDVDNDGDVDLALTSDGDDYVFRNDGGFTFVNATPARLGLQDGEGLAFADFDRDGDVDLLINQVGGNELWVNSTNDSNYLMVRALHDLGGGVRRDAIGATLTLLDCVGNVMAGIRDVNGGSGFGTQKPAYVHYGLPTVGSPSGPADTYIVRAEFVGGTVVGKAVVPSALGSYQLVTIADTDATDVSLCGTAVSLVRFEASGRPGAVELLWETGSEIRNLGFHLERSRLESGPFERITPALVPGLGSSPEGARYRFLDVGVEPGKTYAYRLQDVESNGRVTTHGPVFATPLAAGSVGPPDSSAAIEIGNSLDNALVIRRDTDREMVLVLETRGLLATVDETGAVAIEIPGFVPGSRLPVKRTWIAAIAGRGAEISSVRASEVLPLPWRPAFVSSDVEMQPSGAVKTRRRRSAPPPAPTETARLLEVAYQGEEKKMLLELSPLVWSEASGLSLAQRLEIRVVFRGREGDGNRRREPASGRRAGLSGVWARLATVERGLYAVRFEDLPRDRPVSTSELALFRAGEPRAYHVEPRTGRFGPGSTLYFLSEGADSSPYAREAVFELVRGEPGIPMEVRSEAPRSANAAGELIATLVREESVFYQAGLLEARDPWLWDLVPAGHTKSFAFVLEGLAPSSATAELRLFLQGTSDLPVAPDHHVAVHVNGVIAGEISWDGKKPARFVAKVDASRLVEGENRLEVENIGDTGASYSMVMLDRFELDYSRRPELEGGRLEGVFRESGRAVVAASPDGVLALDVTDEHPLWLSGARQREDAWEIDVVSGRKYFFLPPSERRRPSIRKAAPDRLRPARRADYLVVGPRELVAEIGPLASHRRTQGLRVETVTTEEIYDTFGYGESTPEAIRRFLIHAYHHWRSPSVRYVLLVGDGSYDFKDYLGTGVPNHVPPYMVVTSFLLTASDPAYGAVNGEDGLPDVAVGRVPAKSPADVRRFVAKVLEYERSERRPGSPIVLVADDPDSAANFTADAESLAKELLAGRDVNEIYLERRGVEESREAIRAAFGDARVLSYLGHGGIHLWADENLFDTGSVQHLGGSSRPPIVLTMNCLNGYFHFPYFDSLGESLVGAEGRGAIAALAPSGLSLAGPAAQYHREILKALLEGGHRRLGDAILAAQARYAEIGSFPELLAIYHLFGDPALEIGF